MFWILQNNVFNEEGWESLTTALNRLGVPFTTTKCIPFVGQLEPEPQPTEKHVIVMGSYTLALEAKKRGWRPGAFIGPNLDYLVQLDYWENAMFNSDAAFSRFDCVMERNEPFFIRPIEDSKSFSGMVTDWPSFKEWQTRMLNLHLDDARDVKANSVVMVSSKKPIYAEYRIWIIDQQAVTWSQYKIGTMKHYRQDVDRRIIDFANEQAKIWSPYRAYCMDVFDTPKGPKIGEVNNINSSGFYAADMNKLVIGLESMVF